jgi:phi13 family phage major tail protein
MAANGRVITGFSKPYVALYAEAGGVVSYSSAQILARGVSVSFDIEDATDDNNFYADNILAESVSGTFGGGSVTLTVDGLFTAAEKLILGLPSADGDGWTSYDDDMSIPNVGIGFVVRYMSDGVTSYVPVVLTKCKFATPSLSANTQEEEIDWQTQELTANVMRDDSAKHCWMKKGDAQTTEALAETMITDLLS